MKMKRFISFLLFHTFLKRVLIRFMISGQEAFYNAAPSQLKKLAQAELNLLRMALRLTNCAPAELVYQEARWLPLDQERKLRVAQYTIRAFEVENTVDEELSTSFDNKHSKPLNSLKINTPTLWRRTIPIADFTKPLFDDCDITPKDVSKTPTNPYPPWAMKEPNIETSFKTNCTKKENPLYLKTLAEEKIDKEFQSHLKIFTDGSVHADGKVGCAFTIPELNITKKFRLNKGSSIFTAEIYAILQACIFLAELQTPPKSVVILSDSSQPFRPFNLEAKIDKKFKQKSTYCSTL